MADSSSSQRFFIGFLTAFCCFLLLFLVSARVRNRQWLRGTDTDSDSLEPQYSEADKPRLYEPFVVSGGQRWAEMMPLSLSSRTRTATPFSGSSGWLKYFQKASRLEPTPQVESFQIGLVIVMPSDASKCMPTRQGHYELGVAHVPSIVTE